jgi:hypothetical protein
VSLPDSLPGQALPICPFEHPASSLQFPELSPFSLSFPPRPACVLARARHSAAEFARLFRKSLPFNSLPPLGFSCLSFSCSLPLFSTACSLFYQNAGMGYVPNSLFSAPSAVNRPLSPLPATHTKSAPVTPVPATHTKNKGVGGYSIMVNLIPALASSDQDPTHGRGWRRRCLIRNQQGGGTRTSPGGILASENKLMFQRRE